MVTIKYEPKGINMHITAVLLAAEVAQSSPYAMFVAVVVLAAVVLVALWVIVTVVRLLGRLGGTLLSALMDKDSTTYERIVGLISVSRTASATNDDRHSR